MKNLVFKKKTPTPKGEGIMQVETLPEVPPLAKRQRSVPLEDKLLFVALTALMLAILREVVR